MKKTIAFLCGLCTGLCLIMLWLHRGMIVAALKGEELPEVPESCPAFKKK
jgi:hypothetical protein